MMLAYETMTTEFIIQYNRIDRIFVLPEPNNGHVSVIVTIREPPIRRGKDLYCHIGFRFKFDGEVMVRSLREDKRMGTYKGQNFEVFYKILRDLSRGKVTKVGEFLSCKKDYVVECSFNDKAGFLYPIMNSFFFLPRPPTRVLHEEIDFVEFVKHAASGSNWQCFDLLIRLNTEQEHLFRNIQRKEYEVLDTFVSKKGLQKRSHGGNDDGSGGEDGDQDSEIAQLEHALEAKREELTALAGDTAGEQSKMERLVEEIESLREQIRNARGLKGTGE